MDHVQTFKLYWEAQSIFRYFVFHKICCHIICLYFYVINMVDEEACKKRFVNSLSFSVLYMFIKNQENLRLTIYEIEMLYARRYAWYCAWWARKNNLGTWFFSMPDKHISSNYEPNVLIQIFWYKFCYKIWYKFLNKFEAKNFA